MYEVPSNDIFENVGCWLAPIRLNRPRHGSMLLRALGEGSGGRARGFMEPGVAQEGSRGTAICQSFSQRQP